MYGQPEPSWPFIIRTNCHIYPDINAYFFPSKERNGEKCINIKGIQSNKEVISKIIGCLLNISLHSH
jgi:hypothetical protein